MDTILIVDHDEKKAVPLIQKLKEEVRLPKTGQVLGSEYHFAMEIVEENESAFSQKAKELAATYRQAWPRAILVDLVMPHDTRRHLGGVQLLKALKPEFPRVPAALYTTITLNQLDAFEASSNIDNPIIDLSLPEAAAVSLVQVFDMGLKYATCRAEETLNWVLGSPSCWDVHWDPHTGADVEYRRAVEALSWEIFRSSEDFHRLHLAKIASGFSGTSLVKVTAFDAKGTELANKWLLKVAEHQDEIEKLAKEIEGYGVMKNRSKEHFRTELDRATSEKPKALLKDWWAAIAVSYQEDLSTLLERFDKISAASVYKMLFQECLNGVYGETGGPTSFQILSPQTLEEATDSLKEIARWYGAVSRYYKGIHDDGDVIQQGFTNGRAEGLREVAAAGCGSSFRYVHGDLNCRNIMVSDDGTRFKLVDFPHVVDVEDRPAATDFAKAEAELLFIMMDYHTGFDIDPARVPTWIKLFESSCQSLTHIQTITAPSADLDNVVRCLVEIRLAYQDLVGNDEASWKQYRLLLLENCLHYITYEDLTPAKRCAAVVYARMLLDSF